MKEDKLHDREKESKGFKKIKEGRKETIERRERGNNSTMNQMLIVCFIGTDGKKREIN